MGAQAQAVLSNLARQPSSALTAMAPMKVMKGTGKAMTKGAIAKTIAEEFELKQNVATKIIDSFSALATKEVVANGIFSFPGLCRIKTRVKPATKACQKEIFGKMQTVKARPARTIVKAFPVAALKKSVLGCARASPMP